MWSDLCDFYHFGKIFKVCGNILKVYFALAILLNPLWQLLHAIGQIFIDVRLVQTECVKRSKIDNSLTGCVKFRPTLLRLTQVWTSLRPNIDKKPSDHTVTIRQVDRSSTLATYLSSIETGAASWLDWKAVRRSIEVTHLRSRSKVVPASWQNFFCIIFAPNDKLHLEAFVRTTLEKLSI